MKINKLIALTGGVALAAMLAACGGEQQSTGATLATVNGMAVKESRITEQLAQIPQTLLQGREAEIRKQLLDRVIDQELVAQEAKRLNVEKDADYQQRLKMLTLQLQADAVMARKISESVTDASIQTAYEARRAQLAFPAVKAKHILVASEAAANAIIAIVTPQNFSELARERSTSPNSSDGGELGWFRREAMIPAFARVAFSTPVGTVAPTPVKTEFGYHVILVEDRNDAYVPPLEQVAGQLREELAQTVVQGYLADLRRAATISYADGSAAPVVSPTAPVAAQ